MARIRLSKDLRRKAKEETRIVSLERQLSDLNGVLRGLLLAQQQQQQHEHGGGKRRRRRRRREVPVEVPHVKERVVSAVPMEVMDSWDAVGSPMVGSPMKKVVGVQRDDEEVEEDEEEEDEEDEEAESEEEDVQERLNQAKEFASPEKDGTVGLPRGGHEASTDQDGRANHDGQLYKKSFIATVAANNIYKEVKERHQQKKY